MTTPQTFARLRPSVAKHSRWRYGAPVTVKAVEVPAKSGAGRRNPNIRMAHKRPHTIAGAFFSSAMSFYGGCTWAGFGLAGVHSGRFPTPRTAATQSRRKDGGGSNLPNGAIPMRHIPARSPSTASTRAAAHRAMALAALRADSSLSVRLKRYNDHMAKARALEASNTNVIEG